uniref:Hypothetical fusion protein n=1 Tax=Transmissible gastroenteritis virus TaxID=11149 RepID=Q9YQ11_TGEV|nr:hypothetical fusion protein [Transmissible gastroenteritis virus]
MKKCCIYYSFNLTTNW